VVTVPPVASDLNGPNFCVLPSGLVTTTVKFVHLSPYCALAVGGGALHQKLTLTVCPTPIGFGAMLTYMNVGICQGGVCALACGNNTIEAVIEIVKIATIRVANVFLSSFCIFSFSPFY
jgi:hypothetical protein